MGSSGDLTSLVDVLSDEMRLQTMCLLSLWNFQRGRNETGFAFQSKSTRLGHVVSIVCSVLK